MESRVLFLGPVGAGKTAAVRAISDIEVVGTDMTATDEVRLRKPTTTVAMDMGILQLDGDDRIVMYGAPGQDRFDFMWDILLEQSNGVVLTIDHSAADPAADFARYRKALLRPGRQRKPAVVGVTHMDLAPQRPLSLYEELLMDSQARCGCAVCSPPIQPMDARQRADVRAILITLAAILDVHQRFQPRTCLA